VHLARREDKVSLEMQVLVLRGRVREVSIISTLMLGDRRVWTPDLIFSFSIIKH